MTKEPQRLAIRAFDSSGTRELLGLESVTVSAPAHHDETSQERMAAEVASLLGGAVALLGHDGDDVVCVEVLTEPTGPRWGDAELPDGWRERSPWRQPGWYGDTVATIDRALTDAGRRRTGPAVQVKHWSISALMRIPTDAGEVWFKQTPPLFAHEGKVVGWLADLAPHLIGTPLAVGPDWWIAVALAPATEVPAGQELGALGVLHELQLLAAGHADELLQLGCPDRRLPTLLADVAAMVERADLLPEDQRAGLHNRLPVLAAKAEQLAAAGLPDTLVHGDFHSGNQRLTAGGWVIYDWTDASLAHPLTDLAPAGIHDGEVVALTDGRLTETVRLWQAECPGLTDEVAELGIVVGTAHQLVTYQRLADGTEREAGQMWGGACTGWAKQLIRLLAP